MSLLPNVARNCRCRTHFIRRRRSRKWWRRCKIAAERAPNRSKTSTNMPDPVAGGAHPHQGKALDDCCPDLISVRCVIIRTRLSICGARCCLSPGPVERVCGAWSCVWKLGCRRLCFSSSSRTWKIRNLVWRRLRVSGRRSLRRAFSAWYALFLATQGAQRPEGDPSASKGAGQGHGYAKGRGLPVLT